MLYCLVKHDVLLGVSKETRDRPFNYCANQETILNHEYTVEPYGNLSCFNHGDILLKTIEQGGGRFVRPWGKSHTLSPKSLCQPGVSSRKVLHSTLDTHLFLKLHDNWLRIWKTLNGLHVIILRNFVI